MDPLIQFGMNDPGSAMVAQEAAKIHAGIEDLSARGYNSKLLSETRDAAIAQTINKYEDWRTAQLDALNEKDLQLRDTYKTKVLLSAHAEKERARLDLEFSGLSKNELQERIDQYIGGAELDPLELQTLSKYAMTRGLDVDSFRNVVKSRGDHEPWQKLAPDMYRDMAELRGLKYGEMRLVILADGKRVAQNHSIADLIK